MIGETDPEYREGLARVLLAACFLLFSISLGIIFVGAAALGPPGILGALAWIIAIAFAFVGFGLAFSGFSMMSGNQSRSSKP